MRTIFKKGNKVNVIETGYIPGTYIHHPGGEGKIVKLLDTDEWRELIQIRKEWTDKGYTLKGTDGDAGGDRKLLPEEIPFAVETYKPGIEQSVANSLGYPIKAIRQPSYSIVFSSAKAPL